MRIEQEQIGWRKGIETQHGLHHCKQARRRPRLRPVCFRIKRWEWVFIIPRMTAETLRKAVIVEQGTDFKDCTRNGMKLLDQPEAHHAHGEASVLDRPH